ncbi:MAG: hypothetical protein AB7O45_12310 [Alphaproteobacteria bacterium]
MRFAIGLAVCLALGALAIVPSAAAAQEITALRGELMIGGRHLVDPPPADPKNSHAYLTIKGAAAMRIFRNMNAKEEWDYCLGKSWMRKQVGNLSCSILRASREAVCSVTIDLRSGASAEGGPC